jgi:hypothetical protein
MTPEHALDRRLEQAVIRIYERYAREVVERFDEADLQMDAFAAPAFHAALPLTRREAADPAPFRYLAIVRHPEVVRHRWPYRSFATMRQRFVRHGTRHDANAFSRWWWIAELTRDGSDYELTRSVLARSSLATHLFSRHLCHHRPAIQACIDVLGEAPGAEVEATLRIVGKALSTRVFEAMTREELREVVAEARTVARASS